MRLAAILGAKLQIIRELSPLLKKNLKKNLENREKVLIFAASECRQRARNNMFEEHDFKLDLSDPHNEGIAKKMVMPSVFHHLRYD